MLESHFQLQRRPFASVPSPDQYFPTTSMEAARCALVRLIERQEGPAIVVGSVGTGKSLLCQTLAESFRHLCRVLVLPCGRVCTRRALLQVILYQLGLPYRDMEEGELRLYLIDHLTNKSVCPTGILLLVDEADQLALALLDELRALTNLTTDGQSCVRLVLFGSPRLEEKFAHPRLESFNQRLAGRFYLEPFLRDETIQYIVQQYLESGGDPKALFRDSGLETIHQATGGIPRLVNQLTDHSMILVAVGQHQQIDRDCVEDAWADLQQLPLPHRRHDGAHRPHSNIVEFGNLQDESDDDVQRAERRLNDIERHLDQFDAEGRLREEFDNDEYASLDRPLASTEFEPEVTLHFHAAHNPFGDDFEEEELVVDEFFGNELPTAPYEKTLAWRPERTRILESTKEVKQPQPIASTEFNDDAPTNQPAARIAEPVEPRVSTNRLSEQTVADEMEADQDPPASVLASVSPERSDEFPLPPSAEVTEEPQDRPNPVQAAPVLPPAPAPASTASPSAEAILRSLAASSQFIVEPDYQRRAREHAQPSPAPSRVQPVSTASSTPAPTAPSTPETPPQATWTPVPMPIPVPVPPLAPTLAKFSDASVEPQPKTSLAVDQEKVTELDLPLSEQQANFESNGPSLDAEAPMDALPSLDDEMSDTISSVPSERSPEPVTPSPTFAQPSTLEASEAEATEDADAIKATLAKNATSSQTTRATHNYRQLFSQLRTHRG